MAARSSEMDGGAAIASGASPPATGVARRLARNSLWNLGGWVVTLALNFVAAPITVRQLGPDAYGILSLLVTVIAPLGVFDLGLGEATVKYMAEGFGRNEPQTAEGYFRSTLLFNLVVGVAGALAIAAAAPWLVVSLFKLPVAYHGLAQLSLYFIGLNWALTMAAQTYIGALTALQSYRILSLGNLLVQGGTLVVGIVVLLAGGNLLHLVISQSTGQLLGTVGWWWAVRRALPGFRLSPHWSRESIRRTAGMGVWQTVNKIGGLLAYRAQYWLLGVSLPVAVVGYYNLGYQVVTIIYLMAYKVGQVVFPAVSHLQGEGREDEAARHTVSATWLCSLAGVALVTAVLCLAHDFLRLWVGEAVATAATTTLQVLALHTGVSVAFAVPSFFLLGTGRSRWLAIMSPVQGAVTFGTAWILLPHYGLVGAAWGVLAGAVVHVVVLGLLWQRILHLWIGGRVFLAAMVGPIAVGLLVAWAFVWLRAQISGPLGWPGLIVAGTVCTAFSSAAILAVDSLLPDGSRRRSQLRRLLQTAWTGSMDTILRRANPAAPGPC